VLTGLLVKYFGWRSAFVVPAMLSFAAGAVFARWSVESEPPARRGATRAALPTDTLARAFAVITLTATTGNLLFNFTTNGNNELLRERMAAVVSDPATLGLLLAGVYTLASFSQLIVGRLIDRYPIRRLLLAIACAQIPLFIAAAYAEGWAFYALAIGFMVFVFGAIPFTDAMVVRFVDDHMRSRVSGARITVSFGISSLAVYLLGPIVKAEGFDTLLLLMAAVSCVTVVGASLLPAVAHR
jgi:predicted MFS family arabinose efflux permease